MNVFELPFAFLAFLGMVMVMPAWIWFTTTFDPVSSLSIESTLLMHLVLPATAMLLLASWLEGGTAR